VNSGDRVLDTYRFLRGGLVVMVVMLFASMIVVAITTGGCWQTSISAYYYNAAHSVFVASLCAIGTLMITYRGSNDTEDILLDLAGILAFVVAMVPTARPDRICGPALPEYVVDPAIRNNMWAVIAGLVFAKVGASVLYRSWRAGPPGLSRYGQWAFVVFWTTIFFGVITFIVFPEQFAKHAHTVAAILMFACIIAVVVINAYLADNEQVSKPGYVRAYRMVALAMFATLLLVAVLHKQFDPDGNGWNYAVILAEILLIAEFGIYWALQTRELWRTTDRSENTVSTPMVKSL
jgi:hypothetical protein